MRKKQKLAGALLVVDSDATFTVNKVMLFGWRAGTDSAFGFFLLAGPIIYRNNVLLAIRPFACIFSFFPRLVPG